MSAAPRLLEGKRRGLAAALAVLALGEAVLVVLFAAAIERLLAATAAPLLPLLAAGGIAAMAGAVLLLGRWLGEDFAQSYLGDCRAALFAAVARQPLGQGDARWLTVLVHDMDPLHDFALRGTVRLWTGSAAAGAAAGWILVTMPHFAPGLIPLVGGAALIALLAWPLARTIAAQRKERGRLNRYLTRRMRQDLAGTPPARGEGAEKLAALSGSVRRVALRRAVRAGALDAATGLAALVAALLMVWPNPAEARGSGLLSGVILLGYVAARLLGAAQTLPARIDGGMARVRLRELLALVPAPQLRRTRTRPRSHARPRRGLPRWARWLPLRLNLNLSLPAPQPRAGATRRTAPEESEA